MRPGVVMYAFIHKFHVHIFQEHTVDTDRCVCLYASAPARHSDYRCTFAHVITFVGTARNRRHVAKPSCRTHRGSSLTTCRPPVCCRTRPSCRTNHHDGPVRQEAGSRHVVRADPLCVRQEGLATCWRLVAVPTKTMTWVKVHLQSLCLAGVLAFRHTHLSVSTVYSCKICT